MTEQSMNTDAAPAADAEGGSLVRMFIISMIFTAGVFFFIGFLTAMFLPVRMWLP